MKVIENLRFRSRRVLIRLYNVLIDDPIIIDDRLRKSFIHCKKFMIHMYKKMTNLNRLGKNNIKNIRLLLFFFIGLIISDLLL